jgi:hypothetical protein
MKGKGGGKGKSKDGKGRGKGNKGSKGMGKGKGSGKGFKGAFQSPRTATSHGSWFLLQQRQSDSKHG